MRRNPNTTTNQNKRLILRWMPMDGYHSPGPHSIQEPMSLFIQRLVEALCRDHTQKGRLQSQYIFLPRGFIRPVFDFHYDSAGFQGADGVPLVCGNAQRHHRAARTRVQGPTDRAREGLPYPASGLGEAGFGPGWLPGIGPAPIQEWCPQIPVFQADGTVSKVRRFRGDCKCGVAGNEQLQG